MIKTKQPLLRI